MLVHDDSGGKDVTACWESTDSPPNLNNSIGCLPPEIISHIFVVGSQGADEEEPGDDETSSLDGSPAYFATLCSHVCQYWRTIAIDTPQLWSSVDFEGVPPFEKSKEWIARSKAAPLTIRIDHTGLDDPELEATERQLHIEADAGTISEVMVLISSETYRWRSLEVVSDYYELVWLWQQQFINIGPTPNLEYLGFFCHEEWMDSGVFHPEALRNPVTPIFPTGVPKLQSVSLWGVHVDWKSAIFLEGLKCLQLAWHTKDVRPSCEQFIHLLNQSPNLEVLTLEGSAPLPGTWPRERIPFESLRDLVITHVDIEEASAIVDGIHFPALRSLTLDLEDDNMKPFIDSVCKGEHPRFETVESLKLTSFNCRPNAGEKFLGSMPNLKSLTLNFNYLPLHFRQALVAPPLLCPKIDTLKLSGLDDKTLKGLIRARKKGPTPIQRLYLDQDDDLAEGTVQWLKQQVETVKFYEASDDEDDEDSEDEDEDEE